MTKLRQEPVLTAMDAGRQARVTVIVPAYNVENSIAKTIESVLSQTYTAWRMVVVDDGSRDATVSVVERFVGAQVDLVRQENKGQGAARNAGMRLIDTAYFTFLDADDYWLPDFLAEAVAFLDHNIEAIAVSCAYMIESNGRSVLGPNSALAEVRTPMILDSFFEFWARHNHVRTGTVLMRSTAVQSVGLQRADLRISQDLEYWAMLGTQGRWGFLPRPLWVGGSREASKNRWLAKYSDRRRLCPTVDLWQQRVAPRVDPVDLPHFKRVRGRVAAGYAHAMLLAGRDVDARQTVDEYLPDMPATPVTRLFRLATGRGAWRWWLVVLVVRLRELMKHLGLGHRQPS